MSCKIMENYKKQLLKKMHYEEVSSNNEPLKNVREGLGSIALAKGNPLTKTEIKLNTRINFFRNQQAITSAQLPVNLRGQFPVYLFGLTDFYSGFPKNEIDLPISNPWISNLNYSYHEGDELVDQTAATGWRNAAYWNVIPAVFTFAPLVSITDTNDGAINNTLIKNNFSWIPGHLYKISYTCVNTSGVYEAGFSDGVNFNVANSNIIGIPPNDPLVPLQKTVEYYYIPSNTNLAFTSGLSILGEVIDIIGLSIREVLGNVSYPSDNSIGIFGYNKSFCLSPNVFKGDLVITYNFIERIVQPGIGFAGINLFTAEIIVHCNNVAFGTFLNSFVSDLITINTLRYMVPIANINQFINPLKFGYQTLFGKTFTDDIDPRNYITSRDFQQQISDIPINLPIDKQMMLGVQINFDCPTFDMILFVEKVEPLTYKK